VLSKELKEEKPERIAEQQVEDLQLIFKRLSMKYSDKIHDEELKVYSELADSLFEVRLAKVLEGHSLGDSFDSWEEEILSKLREFYVSFVMGHYPVRNGKVLCRVVKELYFSGTVLKPGDLIFMEVKKAVGLLLSGVVEPCSLFKKTRRE